MFRRTAKKDDATRAGTETESSAKTQYVTRAECVALINAAVNAAIDAQSIINREIAGGARDAFFGVGRLEGRLQQEASSGDLPKAVVRCLQRSVASMSGKAVKPYGVDRGAHRAPGQPWST